MIFIVILSIFVLAIYLYLTRHFNYWKKRNIPFVKPMPIFGNIFEAFVLKKPPGEIFHEIYKSTTHPLVGFFVFDQPYLMVRTPELAKNVLIKDFDTFSDRIITDNERDDELASNILFILKNPAWKSIRSKVTPAFSSGKIKNMFPLIRNVGDDMLTYIDKFDGKALESRELCGKFSTDVIASCAFGITANAFKDENAAFRVMARKIFSWKFTRAVQMAAYFFAPILVKPFRMKFIEPSATTFMTEVFWKTILEREQSGTKRGDLIDILVNLRKDPSGHGLDLEGNKLVAQASQFFMAGFETTGSTISFTMFELAKHRDIQVRLRKDVQNIIKSHGELSYDAVQEMKYLDMVIYETLRVYPLLPFLDRRCLKDCQIPGSDFLIEKGTPVFISLYGFHYDSQYFPDPEKFDPERFSDENKDSIPSCCYLPFGDGPHNCIGARFGMLSVKTALAKLLTTYDIYLAEGTPTKLKMDPKGIVLSPKDGVNLLFREL